MAANPDLDAEELEPGDVVLYPEEPLRGESDEPAEEALPSVTEPPPGGGMPPQPSAPAPGSTWDVVQLFLLDWAIPVEPTSDLRLIFDVVQFLGLDLPGLAGAATGEPVGVHAEALALQTDAAYEAVHCYVGMAESCPQWYPDEDIDQTTDESFASLGGGSWDIASHLSGSASTTVFWPDDQPLPIEITCVGTSGGGTDAVELGQVELSVRPEFWDGIIRSAASEGGEGSFTLDYRINRVEQVPIGPLAWIDDTMTPPTDLRRISAAGGNYWLGWEYEPRTDPAPEAPIDGFRIYLNDTLQWIEPPDSRFTALPRQWTQPPCGDEYRFYVTAFYYQDCPDCRESEHSNEVAFSGGEIGDPGCEQTVIVTFQTLTTGSLNVDGRRDPGDVGPVYGSFYVNEQSLGFSGIGLNHNSEYNIHWLAAHYGDGSPQFVVDIPPRDATVQIGFHLVDEDTGRNNADDEVCRGEVLREFDHNIDETIDTWMPLDAPVDRCRVAYTLRPAPGAPVTEPGAPPPLPLLRVENMSVQEPGGQLKLHLRNAGTATWPRKDLDVEVIRPTGESIGVHTWPELVLEPGERTVLQTNLTPERPLNTCVILDPENRVTEDLEGIGETSRRYCQPLPDLTISDLNYDPTGDRLLVRVQNVAMEPNVTRKSLEHRDLSLTIRFADGTTLPGRPTWWSDITIRPAYSTVLEWPEVNEGMRETMREGYTVILDPNDRIAETDETNNQYVVPAAARLRFAWTELNTRYYPLRPRSDSPQEQTFSMEISAVPMSSQGRQIAAWTHGPFEVEHGCRVTQHRAGEVEFEIAGDEVLTVFANANMKYQLAQRYLSWTALSFSPEDEWGVGATISEDEECGGPGWTDRGYQAMGTRPPYPWQSCGPWYVWFVICRVE